MTLGIEAILFDAEGIVVDTETLWDREQEEFLQRRGFPYDRARLKPLLTGRSLVEGVRILQEELGFGGDTGDLARERRRIARALFTGEVRWVDGFPEFFERVRERFKTAIATAMDPDLLRLADERLGLSARFPGTIVTLSDVGGRGKPDPALFLCAAARLGVLPPRCLVLEDSPHGVEAARRANMRCVALTTTYAPETLRGADAIVGSFAEIELADS
ncbi:MAG: HAD family phosphatase [Deltaproteobacteria bacterium]|nr:HAD family phosphatase [Deltaproteobacteria bacterium]